MEASPPPKSPEPATGWRASFARAVAAALPEDRDLLTSPGAWVAGISLGVVLFSAVLWWGSLGAWYQFDRQIGSNHLQVGSAGGTLLVGVFQDASTRGALWRWRTRRQSDLSLLANTSNPGGFNFVSDDLGWGIAIPYPWIMLGASIPVAWWLIVHRDRRERERRAISNCCRHCGYDLRMSPDHCPECGRYVGRLKHVEPV